MLSEREGFGINTNILETNVLNLAVVIWILIYFGKDILLNSLEIRRESIIKSLEDSLLNKKKADDDMLSAFTAWEDAQDMADEIIFQAILSADQIWDKLFARMKEDIKRMEDSRNFTIKIEKEKAITEVVRHVF
jgi:F-type H+-transporting ATPase subunit b